MKNEAVKTHKNEASMNRILSSFLLMTCAVVSLAFQWPWEVQQQGAAKKKSMGVKANQKALTTATKTTPKEPKAAIKKSASAKEQEAVTAAAVKQGAEADAAAIQNQINDIIRVNESVKLRYKEQAKEIEQISVQAKVHQKLFTELQPPPASVPSYPAKDAAEMLRQEKIRVIQDQTQRNTEILEAIQRNESVRR